MKKTVIAIVILVCIGVFTVFNIMKAGFFDFFKISKDVLSVSGNELQLNGEKIILSGVAVGDSYSRSKIDGRTVDDYSTLKKDWQANAVRISFHPGVYKYDEKEGKKIFQTIYGRPADVNNQFDASAIMIMSYGLRQRAENRNLASERAGLFAFNAVFGAVPKSTQSWNVLQAITYSGAVK